MNYTKYLSDSVDNIISRLISEIDNKVNLNQDIVDDIIAIQEFDLDGVNDENAVKAFIYALIKLIVKPIRINDESIVFQYGTNYGETGEGTGISTSLYSLAFPATSTNRINNSTHLFIRLNDDRESISLVSQGVGINAWYEIFTLPWTYVLLSNNQVILDWEYCGWSSFINSYPVQSNDKRFSFVNRLGEVINPYYMLQSYVTNYQPVIILREVLDLARSRDFSNASLQSRCTKLGDYAEWTQEAQMVYNDVSSALSSCNPYAIIKLVQYWFQNSNVSSEDPGFSEAPPLVKSFCLSAILSAGVQIGTALISMALTLVSGVLGIVSSIIGGIISTVWQVISSSAGAEYSIVWGKDGSSDTDSRAIDIPFSRGYVSIPADMEHLLVTNKIVTIHVPGCEIVLWDNDNLTDGLACYEMRVSLNWNFGTHLEAFSGFFSNGVLYFNRLSATHTTVSLNPNLTVSELMAKADEFYSPLTLFRDLKGEEIEMRISSGLFIFGLWLLSEASSLTDEAIVYSAEGSTSLIALCGSSTTNNVSFNLLHPILLGLTGLAINVKDVDLNNYYVDEISGLYEPVYQEFVNPQFTEVVLNYLINLSSKSYVDGDSGNNVIVTSEWFSATIDFTRNSYFATQGIYNQFLSYNYGEPWGEGNTRPTFDSNDYQRDVFSKTFNLITLFDRSNDQDVTQSVITGAYKGVPFCKAPEYNSIAIISALAIGAAVVAAVSIGISVGFTALKRSLTRKQLSMQGQLSDSRDKLLSAASSGSPQEYKKAYRNYKRQTNRYNWMSKVTGMPKYNRDTGLYSDTVYPSGRYGEDLVPSSTSVSSLDDGGVTLDVIYTVLCGPIRD